MSDYTAASYDFSRDDDDSPRRGSFSAGRIGLGLIIAGLVAVLVTWLQIKDIQNQAAQIPYIVSGGIVGLGLMVMGSVAHFANEVELGRASRAELRQLRAQLAALTETANWTADAVEQVAQHLNHVAADEPATAGSRRK